MHQTIVTLPVCVLDSLKHNVRQNLPVRIFHWWSRCFNAASEVQKQSLSVPSKIRIAEKFSVPITAVKVTLQVSSRKPSWKSQLQRGIETVKELSVLPWGRGLWRPCRGRQHQDTQLDRVRGRDLQSEVHRGRDRCLCWPPRRQYQGGQPCHKSDHQQSLQRGDSEGFTAGHMYKDQAGSRKHEHNRSLLCFRNRENVEP